MQGVDEEVSPKRYEFFITKIFHRADIFLLAEQEADEEFELSQQGKDVCHSKSKNLVLYICGELKLTRFQ